MIIAPHAAISSSITANTAAGRSTTVSTGSVLAEQDVNLTVSHISAPRRLCDWSVAAWTSRQTFDERADQPSTHGCD
jgi:hypothetical protein